MKIIIIICLLLLSSCQIKNDTVPISSPEEEQSTPIYVEPEYTYQQLDDILNYEDEIDVDTNFEPITFNNPIKAYINNEVTIQKLNDPYFRIYRTYKLNYEFYYEKDDEQRYAYLEIINYRNHPGAYSNDVYECYLTVPQSSNEENYHFYGLPSWKDIFIFNEDGTTENLYFAYSLQQQIIDHLIKAQDEINGIDEDNLQYSYDYILSTYNLSYFINRTYFPHNYCSNVISDYLYFPNCNLSFFKQTDPVMKDVAYYNTDRHIVAGYYRRVFSNTIITGIDPATDIMALAILDSEVICEAGGGNRGMFQMIDMQNGRALSFNEIAIIYNLNMTKIQDFYEQNKYTIFTNNSCYAALFESPENNTLIYDGKIYFLTYQPAEHGGTSAISFPIEAFQ